MLAGLATALADELRQSLNGSWQFATSPEAPTWDTMVVPGNWDTQPAYATYKGRGWYRREFEVPAEMKGKHLRLRFDAVYHDATVWLNGVELGSHSGGYTPFEFDVTSQVKFGAANKLVVSADNTYRRGAWWHWGGISRNVTLLAFDAVRIVWQHVRTEPNLQSGAARIVVQYKLANASETAVEARLSGAIDGEAFASLSQVVTVPPRADAVVEAVAMLPRERVRLWDFDHPNLYQLTSELSVAKTVAHRRADRFGIRQVELRNDGLYLNGEKIRLNGFNRVSDSPEFGNTEPDELVRRDVDLMKSANGNLSRLMHFPQAPNLLDYLDEKGMLIWCEIPVWGADDPQIKTGNRLTRQWMTEMIERDYNHPCIIGWSVGNELTKHREYVNDMMAFTRSLDPHRIVTHVSYTGILAEYTPANDPITDSPVALHNNYGGTRSASAVLHEKWPDKLVFFSEFGLGQFGADPSSQIKGIEALYRKLTEGHPYVIGVSLWTFNDYRSDFRGTPPSGNREWGVVDVHRRPKAAFEQIRRLYSPVHALTIEGGKVRIEPRSPDEVPSYALRGYRLRWPGGEVAVPDLKPGAPIWTAPVTIPDGAVVELVSPTGYRVADTGNGAR